MFTPFTPRTSAAAATADTTAISTRVWYVDVAAPAHGDGRSWTHAFSEIPTAIKTAHAGDQIWCKGGRYPLREALKVPAQLHLFGGCAGTEAPPLLERGKTADHPSILEQQTADQAVVTIVGGHHVRLDGFILTGARGQPGLVLSRCDETVEVTHCVIEKNTAPLGAGVTVRDSSSPRFSLCQIRANHSTGDGGGGLWIDATSGGLWTYCILSENSTAGPVGGGALLQSRATAHFDLCDFFFNEAGTNGSALSLTGTAELRDCIISSNFARVRETGQAIAVFGASSQLTLSGESYVVGNLAGRDPGQFVPGVAHDSPVIVRDTALIAPPERSPPTRENFENRRDVHLSLRDVFLPPLTDEPPAAGRWVRQTLPAYSGTDAYHCLYLPTGWQPERRYPVLVAFPGNGPFRNYYGDRSGGMPEDTTFGIGLTANRPCIVLGLGYLDSRKNNAPTGTWWGDVGVTVDYCRGAVKAVIDSYGGDTDRVVLCGFSRSAIGASFIGLHDDAIAPLWRAFLCYDGWESQADMTRDWYRYDASSYHYDRGDFNGTGVAQRFQRLRGRPVFILGGHGAAAELNASVHFPLELVPKPHRNHNTSWALRETPERAQVRAWLDRVLAEPGASSR